jgi:flavin-dependent dehydrogenase
LLAFLTDSDGADRRRLLHTDGLWASLLQNTRHLRQLCAHHEYHPGTTPAQGADASSACLDQCAAANWIAVGDAAAAFDPLSSKGIAHAIYTGHQAAMALIKTEQTHHPHALMAYDDHIHAIFTHYRHHLRLAYQTETRWPQARFWSSRGGDVLKSRSSK